MYSTSTILEFVTKDGELQCAKNYRKRQLRPSVSSSAQAYRKTGAFVLQKQRTSNHHAQSLRSVLYVLSLPSPCCAQVALKMVNMSEAKDVQRMTLRLKREIRLMKSLKHENIVEYFERKY